jgi:hypothetical protein
MTERTSAAYDEGRLRAYLDNELSPAERQAVEATLAASPQARQQLASLQAQAAQAQAALDTAAAHPDPQAAWNRVHAAIAANDAAVAPDNQRREMMKHIPTWLGAHRALAASLAVIVVLLGLLALPPVRALADQMLQVFRVQEVVFVPISDERIAELENLDFDEATLFVGEPEMTQEMGEPTTVESPDAAAAVVGYPIATPAYVPDSVTLAEVLVSEPGTVSAQINAEAAQQLLDLLNITDVTIPPELGEQPITVDIPATAVLHYEGDERSIVLAQGNSPDVTLPENVDLQQLGQALLRLLGMEQQQAATLSQQIDWSSTLVVPMREDIETLQQVDINGANGLLVWGQRSEEGTHWQLYWQQGEQFYVLHGTGYLSAEEIVAIATSVE